MLVVLVLACFLDRELTYTSGKWYNQNVLELELANLILKVTLSIMYYHHRTAGIACNGRLGPISLNYRHARAN